MPLKKMFDVHDLMEVVVVILNARDPYTFEHSWRVSALCENLVDRMGIPKHWRETIHIAAHLHDIGKIGVPDSILNKPGSLSSAEYDKIKEHPDIGFEIVNSLEALNEIALYVRHHHERWDGKGYPHGLKGKDIPLGARVIAVADTFDAITSLRLYRQTQGIDFALKEIESCSGSQLCPEVCSVFLEMRNEIPGILESVNREIEGKKQIRSFS